MMLTALPSRNAPPSADSPRDRVVALAEALDAGSLWWLSGYLAALAQSRSGTASAPVSETAAIKDHPSVLLVYGSQTGNAKRLAGRLEEALSQAGVAVRSCSVATLSLKKLAAEPLVWWVISTQGDGDPPEDAREFWAQLHSKRAPSLSAQRFAVLGLGDSSYPKFNAVARALDARLAQLGAQRLHPVGECDVDIDTVATPWTEQALQVTRQALEPSGRSNVTPLPFRTAAAAPTALPAEALCEVLVNQRLTLNSAQKVVHHLELDAANLRYEPGDAIGIWPRQSDTQVAQLLRVLKLDGQQNVALQGRTLSLHQWLMEERELTRVSKSLVLQHAALGGHEALAQQARSPELSTLLRTHQLLDLLQRWPTRWEAYALVQALLPLKPRLYSIASSQLAVGDEVHLTVAKWQREFDGRSQTGVASSMLCDALKVGDSVRAFIEPNARFRLPDASSDVIMIGPGTGVAPFRGFLQERAETAASGRNWLFFGEQYFASQFLYQTEWLAALKAGTLHRLDVAFSRDQPERIYVQQRLRERAATLYDWLEGGAHLYLCGDAEKMAPDVESALRDVIAASRQRGSDDAAEYLQNLSQSGRFHRDVY